MANNTLKEVTEVMKAPLYFYDPIWPVKLEAVDFILLNFTAQFVKRLDAIEDHLETGIGQGTPFIRVRERPDVGGAALQDLSDNVRKLSERLDKLESRYQ